MDTQPFNTGIPSQLCSALPGTVSLKRLALAHTTVCMTASSRIQDPGVTSHPLLLLLTSYMASAPSLALIVPPFMSFDGSAERRVDGRQYGVCIHASKRRVTPSLQCHTATDKCLCLLTAPSQSIARTSQGDLQPAAYAPASGNNSKGCVDKRSRIRRQVLANTTQKGLSPICSPPTSRKTQHFASPRPICSAGWVLDARGLPRPFGYLYRHSNLNAIGRQRNDGGFRSRATSLHQEFHGLYQ
ncbi:hypothetical protein BDP81DRAFT_59798 [Colletotrichum phormii]|uniref:Uncharacterized protein n=1 Tax=Colletotrichum phormii TaxID=359342 RepID=A0AAJ0EEW0_9PEZI|nr:uncharacterized protein BDP81DRAFT_59798 [Colletotrichum phormii]KAK1634481.1 hypothetical protein BDP81DRAFT_59798 [Colletotrichum phormii]